MIMSQIQVVDTDIDPDSFDDRNLPSDTHLISFTDKDGNKQVDAVRAYTMVDIFDLYHDKKATVHSIKAGYGRIRPFLYGKIKPEEEAE